MDVNLFIRKNGKLNGETKTKKINIVLLFTFSNALLSFSLDLYHFTI